VTNNQQDREAVARALASFEGNPDDPIGWKGDCTRTSRWEGFLPQAEAILRLTSDTERASPGAAEAMAQALWDKACIGREGYCSSDLKDAALSAIAEAFRLSEHAARSVTLPERYQWSAGNVEKFEFGRDTAADAILALTQASAAKVPEGWKLVPIEPTEAMVDATARILGEDEYQMAAAVWSAMLAATPSETTNG